MLCCVLLTIKGVFVVAKKHSLSTGVVTVYMLSFCSSRPYPNFCGRDSILKKVFLPRALLVCTTLK